MTDEDTTRIIQVSPDGLIDIHTYRKDIGLGTTPPNYHNYHFKAELVGHDIVLTPIGYIPAYEPATKQADVETELRIAGWESIYFSAQEMLSTAGWKEDITAPNGNTGWVGPNGTRVTIWHGMTADERDTAMEAIGEGVEPTEGYDALADGTSRQDLVTDLVAAGWNSTGSTPTTTKYESAGGFFSLFLSADDPPNPDTIESVREAIELSSANP